PTPTSPMVSPRIIAIAWFQSSEHVKPHNLFWRRLVQPIGAGEHAGLHAQREPEVGLLPAGFADESWRRDADDGERRVAHREGLAQHVESAAEATLPVAVTHDGARRLGAVFVGCEDPANRRANAENLKEAARD